MGTEKISDEPDDLQKKKTIWRRITTPCRCLISNINFPLACLLFTLIYWLIFIPIFYYSLEASCPKYEGKYCTWDFQWTRMFWLLTSLVWVIIISIAICYYSCKYGKEDDEDGLQEKIKTGEENKEKDKLLNTQVKYNNLKNEKSNLLITNEKLSHVKKDTGETGKLNNIKVEDAAEKTVTLPMRRSVIITEEINITETQNKPVTEVNETKPINLVEEKKIHNKDEDKKGPPKETVVAQRKNEESIMEEIDKLFPRCSVRRRPDQRKRPDTLIIHSPKYPREEQEQRRFTVQERPRTASPLTPREIYFHDLIEGARRQTLERTENFVENERKHSSNNCSNPKKPEVKDYVLKQRSGTEASSPEYFIANVPNRKSLTTEAFIYVDGGQPQEALTICYIDQNDDVFNN